MTKKLHNSISFSVTSYAAWAPGIETPADWEAWAADKITIANNRSEPALKEMPALLRRRTNMPGKMALETAYKCLHGQTTIPIVFCSRHGECIRSIELLLDVIKNTPLSPTTFSLSVHNACGGLFSIARQDKTNQIALAAGHHTIEHAVIEACSLLADGASAVLLVSYDSPLPEIFNQFQVCDEYPYAFAWLIEPATKDIISLSWSATNNLANQQKTFPKMSGLEILKFFLRKELELNRTVHGQHWQWTRYA